MNSTTTLNCRRRTPSTYHYTKEQVQDFLGSQSSDINSLRQALKRRDFTVKTKQGNFILDKELIDPLVEEFGFKPVLPNYTRILIKVLREDFEGVCLLTYRELSDYIRDNYDIFIDPSDLGKAYRELVAHEKAPESKLIQPTLIKNGKVVDEKTEAAFRAYLDGKVSQGYGFGRIWNVALERFDLKAVKGKIISAY